MLTLYDVLIKIFPSGEVRALLDKEVDLPCFRVVWYFMKRYRSNRISGLKHCAENLIIKPINFICRHHNKICSIEATELIPYTALETLDLSSNEITEIRRGSFPLQLRIKDM